MQNKNSLDSFLSISAKPLYKSFIAQNENDLNNFIESTLERMQYYYNDLKIHYKQSNNTSISLKDIKTMFFDLYNEYVEEFSYMFDVDEGTAIEWSENEIMDILEQCLYIFINTNNISLKQDLKATINTMHENNKFGISIQSNKWTLKDIPNLTSKIQYLKDLPQPQQRTEEWYKYRYNLITASNAYKALGSIASQNSLIYEKCQPLIIPNTSQSPYESVHHVNTNTPTHWGQKYEPVSVMIYEKLFNTKIGDFGCIQHKEHLYIGASPDGINIDPNNEELYGRMLEIKNVVSREITGEPKKEYAIQMQLQMEVCDLDDCDFLETKFKEFDTPELFYDMMAADLDNNNLMMKTMQGEEIPIFYGTIMHMQHADKENPIYVYRIWENHMDTKQNIEEWESETLVEMYEKYNTDQSDQNNNDIDTSTVSVNWVKTIYWKLEVLSCAYIERNKEWFNHNVGQFKSIWKIIEEERVIGYEHRAPKKKVVKVDSSASSRPVPSAKAGQTLEQSISFDTGNGDVRTFQITLRENPNMDALNNSNQFYSNQQSRNNNNRKKQYNKTDMSVCMIMPDY